jgi:D-alanyl-lipoteichoic acid acyltransferase DltB (MBOAT superfamily)
MLFNSYAFLFIFLPIVFVLFHLAYRAGGARGAGALLTLASLVFYGWWNLKYVPLLVLSIVFNYAAGRLICRTVVPSRKGVLVAAIAANLLLLGYFKYTGFFMENLAALTGREFAAIDIILPLAISFFTFTQIAYLVDSYSNEAKEYSFTNYALFVTFFPHLLAGPIIHHKEMMPQFEKKETYGLSHENIAVGLTVFSFGLFKKVMLADNVARFATPVFSAAARGADPTFFEAWIGALAYTFQLYFDFSGYSDMAIGLSLLFGIRLPLNFHSPYKSVNMMEFWRRWHMTMSRFFRDYLYIPFGGNRKGRLVEFSSLLATMLIGGLWHGAGWTFVFWGGLHGIYLVINHGFRLARQRWLGHDLKESTVTGRSTARLVTFLAVVVSWVFFRAESFDAAWAMLRGMAGMNGVAFYAKYKKKFGAAADSLSEIGVQFTDFRMFEGDDAGIWLLCLFIVVWLMPNTQEIVGRFKAALDDPKLDLSTGRLKWRPTTLWAFITAGLLVISILGFVRVSEFLYFQF